MTVKSVGDQVAEDFHRIREQSRADIGEAVLCRIEERLKRIEQALGLPPMADGSRQ